MSSISLTAQPLFRSVTWEEARRLSPWPNRISGETRWEKKRRSMDVVLEEYDRGWYAESLEDWRRFLAANGVADRISIRAVLEYQRTTFDQARDAIVKNPAVYGTADVTQYLVSAGDQLFALDFVAGSELHYQLVAHHLSRVTRACGSTTLVELGCGTGMNLVRCVASGDVSEAYGGEICSNARMLLGEVATASSSPLHPFAFDYRETQALRQLTPLSGKKWVLCTVHSIEQLETGAGPVIDAILDLPEPPTRVVHLEPTLPPNKTQEPELVSSCRKYAALNGYNTDLLELLLERETQGRLTINDVRSRMFGLNAFNPTTLIEWTPRKR